MLISPISSLRVGLRTILANTPGIQVVGEAAAAEGLSALPPGVEIVVLASVELPSNAWLGTIIEDFPECTFLFLIDTSSLQSVLAIPFNRVFGLLTLNAQPEEIATAIQGLRSGLSVIDPQFTNLLHFSQSSSRLTDQRDHSLLPDLSQDQDIMVDSLTGRETEILQALALGLTNKEIAHQFSISEHTVKYHINSLYSKLVVNNRTEAVRQGILLGIITI